ncbi:phosphatase PAP2 family protein [Halosolutus gelatinilyticus]|uniref:phosphatase PAP2 family protein n=1 Tax=Halosolutus gelatinilyticus TaxID=2931975 RepID=UPI001FF10C36|nr:phosphatase PAP2 family protein [Halosolutus gelatinilyticus]
MDRDLGFTRAVRDALPEWTVPVFDAVALLGDEFVLAFVLVAIAAIDAYRSVKRGDERPISNEIGFVLAVVLGGLALTLVLKTSFGFSRPPESLQAIPRDGHGFPSGHTMAATVCWGALALWGTAFGRRERLLGASLAIGLVAASRLVLGVHYVVDVLAAIGFGAGYLLVVGRGLDGDPDAAFAIAAVLGILAAIITGGTAEGILATVGCVGGAACWWALNRPAARKLWVTVVN